MRKDRSRVRHADPTANARAKAWRSATNGLVLVLFVVAVLFSAQRANASPFSLAGTDWEGSRDFVTLAEAEAPGHVVVLESIDFSRLKPEDAVIVLHPEQALDIDNLDRFMREGGRIIVLDDYGESEEFLHRFGVRKVPLPSPPLESLRENPAFALAEPASTHSAATDVERVVTNHAVGLSNPQLSAVLHVRARSGDPVTIAVAGVVDKGRLLAVGDPSIVMNSMLRYGGNKAFAKGLVRYAIADDVWGKRQGKIYVLAGAFHQVGAYGPDRDPTSTAIAAVRDALRTLRKDGLPPAAAYALAVVFGLGLVVWVGKRAGRLHKPSLPRYTKRASPAAQGGVAGHAAVIASPYASRLLAMLELKSALEEGLATHLALPPASSQQDLLLALHRDAILAKEDFDRLSRILLKLGRFETAMLAQQPDVFGRIRDEDVVAMAREVIAILGAAGVPKESAA